MTSSLFLARVVEVVATYLVQSSLFLLVGWLLLAIVSRCGDLVSRRVAGGGVSSPNPGASSAKSPFNPGHPAGVGSRMTAALVRLALSPALTEAVWKCAAVLALLTAPLSVFLGWSRPVWDCSIRETPVSNNTTVETRLEPSEQPAKIKPLEITVAPARLPLPEELAVLDAAGGVSESTYEEGSTARIPFLDEEPSVTDIVQNPVDTQHADIEVGTHFSQDLDLVVSDLSTPNDSPEKLVSSGMTFNEPQDGRAISMLAVAILFWMTLSVIRLFIKGISLHRRLSRCSPLDGELRQMLNGLLVEGTSIRLMQLRVCQSRSRSITEPFACGLFRWTIVLPEGIERQLATAELKAVLAHEVAHLVRRDTWWLWLGEILCTCFAFQPLNFLARRRWQQATELLCDDWAVERHVSATSLANCLARIAEGRLNRKAAVMGLGAVGDTGSLTHRVEWLLRSGRATEPTRPRARRMLALLAFSAGLLVGTYGPRLSLVTPAEARDDTNEAIESHEIALWNDINNELTETLNELVRIESLLSLDPDPEVASAANRLHQRAASLRERLDLSATKSQSLSD